MKRKHRQREPSISQNNTGNKNGCRLEPLVELWIYRILFELNTISRFINKDGFSNARIAEALGLETNLDTSISDLDVKEVTQQLKRNHNACERLSNKTKSSGYLSTNIEKLKALFGLSKIERRVLEFTVLTQCDYSLDATFSLLGELKVGVAQHALSVILDLDTKEIRQALDEQGRLYKTGMVRLSNRDSFVFDRKTNVLSPKFAEYLYGTNEEPIHLLRDIIAPSTDAELTCSDFEHKNTDLELIERFLQYALKVKQQGANILIYGKPGTGKNQLVKVIAQVLKTQLFEVACENSEGEVLNGRQRLHAYQAAQFFFQEKQSLLLFDEMEDIFRYGSRGNIANSKAWFNKVLEENKVPTLWLSNRTEEIDAAFIRRFDIVLELDIPPKKQRYKILEKSCAKFMDTSSLKRISDCSHIPPAIMTRTAKVVQAIHLSSANNGSLQVNAAAAFEHILNNTLKTQGLKPVPKHNANALPTLYDPNFIQADVDMAKIAKGLSAEKSGRLCLYGPPGTGKTAYGRWLAEELELPLIIRKASDLLSKWAGQCEKNIANAFEEASTSNAILMIDEIDGFLQDRRSASQGFEISQVNEMLTQIESFDGVFVASTNLMEGLDQAALRRFDLKVKFDFLSSNQAWVLFKRYCDVLNVAEPTSCLESVVSHLINLTPGDFAAVARRNRFSPVETPRKFIEALRIECGFKEEVRGRIGFGE